MYTYLNRPWLHFLMLGFCLFSFSQWILPSSKPAIGPVSEVRMKSAIEQWGRATGQLPSAEQLQHIAKGELNQEILYQEGLKLQVYRYDPVIQQRLLRNMKFLGLTVNRDGTPLSEEVQHAEALRMGLHLGDEVVRRRIIQVVEHALLKRAGLKPVTKDEIAAEFEAKKGHFRKSERYTLEHTFFSAKTETEVRKLLARVQAEQLSPVEVRAQGSSFLAGYRFALQTPEQLARHLGVEFVRELVSANGKAGEWIGPLASTFGLHLVWIESIEAARDATLPEVRKAIERDLIYVRRQEALAQAMTKLRQHYEIVL